MKKREDDTADQMNIEVRPDLIGRCDRGCVIETGLPAQILSHSPAQLAQAGHYIRVFFC
ncbi:MAG: hypothetical protein V2B19_29965 [Pseudomonadota bacterium]